MDIRAEFEAYVQQKPNGAHSLRSGDAEMFWPFYQAGRLAGQKDMRDRAANLYHRLAETGKVYGDDYSACIRTLPVEGE